LASFYYGVNLASFAAEKMQNLGQQYRYHNQLILKVYFFSWQSWIEFKVKGEKNGEKVEFRHLLPHYFLLLRDQKIV